MTPLDKLPQLARFPYLCKAMESIGITSLEELITQVWDPMQRTELANELGIREADLMWIAGKASEATGFPQGHNN